MVSARSTRMAGWAYWWAIAPASRAIVFRTSPRSMRGWEQALERRRTDAADARPGSHRQWQLRRADRSRSARGVELPAGLRRRPRILRAAVAAPARGRRPGGGAGGFRAQRAALRHQHRAAAHGVARP